MSWRRVERVRTPFQELEAWTTPRAAEIRCAGSVHAWWHERRLLTGCAWDAIAAASLVGDSHPPRSVLLLGVGGATAARVLRHLVPGLELHGVEIDPGILDLARRHLRLDAIGVSIDVADARSWLQRNRRKFDVVIDDCYLGGADDVKADAWDAARIGLLRSALSPEGLLVANIVNAPGHALQLIAAREALRSGFRECRSIHPPLSWNEVFAASDAPIRMARLTSFAAAFADPLDRRWWRRLRYPTEQVH